MRLAGKIAIVTGAASGFGAGIARKFVAEGAKVVLADRDGEAATRAAARIGGDAVGVRADVTVAAD
ncbi:MAG: SDR family NAD(P)-dependent oxidoreductase, partial [Caldimonas sp.]